MQYLEPVAHRVVQRGHTVGISPVRVRAGLEQHESEILITRSTGNLERPAIGHRFSIGIGPFLE